MQNNVDKIESSQIIEQFNRLRSANDFLNMPFDQRFKIANQLLNYLKQNDHYLYRRIPSSRKNDLNHQLINLASNDYLNYTQHPLIKKELAKLSEEVGVGSGSVPMLSGTSEYHRLLESKLAEFTGYENSIVFNSGYTANYGVLTALLSKNDLAIMDTYVHASLIDGCTNCRKAYFIHNDPVSLEHVLKKNASIQNKLIIVDGVYSMDGDLAKLDEIIALGKKYNALVLVDESHALGVVGHQGRGTHSALNIKNKADIITGSLGKALGGIGGFVACSNEVANLIEISCRPFIYSTSIPPGDAACLVKAIDLLETDDTAIKKLWDNINYFKKSLESTEIKTNHSNSAIIPLFIQDDSKLLDLCKALDEENIFINPIFFPVVPRKKSRIRISIHAGLTFEEIDHSISRIEHFAKQFNAI